MASMVETGDRVRIARLGNEVGDVVEVRGNNVTVKLKSGMVCVVSKSQVFIASKATN